MGIFWGNIKRICGLILKLIYGFLLYDILFWNIDGSFIYKSEVYNLGDFGVEYYLGIKSY